MKLDNIFRIQPKTYTKFGSTTEKTIIAFRLKVNPRVILATIDDLVDVGANFIISFYDDTYNVVEDQVVEFYQVTAAYQTLGLTKEEAIQKKNNLVSLIISGTNEELTNALIEYSAINGIVVLPIEEQGPIYYEPYTPGEPGYIEPENNYVRKLYLWTSIFNNNDSIDQTLVYSDRNFNRVSANIEAGGSVTVTYVAGTALYDMSKVIQTKVSEEEVIMDDGRNNV